MFSFAETQSANGKMGREETANTKRRMSVRVVWAMKDEDRLAKDRRKQDINKKRTRCALENILERGKTIRLKGGRGSKNGKILTMTTV